MFLCPDEKVMADDEFTCDLFRFLQLLCEGHNNGESLHQTTDSLKWPSKNEGRSLAPSHRTVGDNEPLSNIYLVCVLDTDI